MNRITLFWLTIIWLFSFSIIAYAVTDYPNTSEMGMATETQAQEIDLFVSDIEKFEIAVIPSFTEEEFIKLDLTMNDTYKKIMQANTTGLNLTLGDSTITKDEVKETQKSWLKYRHSLVRFGQIKYSNVAPVSWKGLLTARRNEQLMELLSWVDEEVWKKRNLR